MENSAYLLIGDLSFPVRSGISGIRTAAKWTFPTHDRVARQQAMQACGSELESLDLTIDLHIDQGQIEPRLTAIREAAAQQQSLDLVYGQGIWNGKYVIESLSVDVKQTMGDGTLWAVSVDLSLKGSTNPDPAPSASLSEAFNFSPFQQSATGAIAAALAKALG